MQKRSNLRLSLSLLIFIASCSHSFFSLAQGSYIPYDRDYYQRIERYEILQGITNPFFNTGYKPQKRDHVAKYLGILVHDSAVIRSRVDQFNLEYLAQDNWEFVEQETELSKRPFLKALYKRPGDFAYYNSDEFDIHVNPVR